MSGARAESEYKIDCNHQLNRWLQNMPHHLRRWVGYGRQRETNTDRRPLEAKSTESLPSREVSRGRRPPGASSTISRKVSRSRTPPAMTSRKVSRGRASTSSAMSREVSMVRASMSSARPRGVEPHSPRCPVKSLGNGWCHPEPLPPLPLRRELDQQTGCITPARKDKTRQEKVLGKVIETCCVTPESCRRRMSQQNLLSLSSPNR